MKKSVLALAVAGALVASSMASAAVVYDKDGTSLSIGGRVEAMWHSGHDASDIKSANDHTIRDRIRLNVNGRSKLTDWATAYGFWETQNQHNGSSTEGQTTSYREAYVGVDFGKFGSVQAGRWEDWIKYPSNVVDFLEDDGCNAQLGRDRNSGKIGYQWSGYGVDFKLSYQTAVNNYSGLGGANSNTLVGNYDVQGGITVALGYTSPDVLFGPISIRTGYQGMTGQKDEDITTAGAPDLKSTSLSVTGISWGKTKNGPYIGATYAAAEAKYRTEGYSKAKFKSFEVLAGYWFSNGVGLRAAYAYKDVKNAKGIDDNDGKMKLVTLAASWDINKNFRVWGEAHFDCDSDDGYARYTKNNGKGANVYKIGARYSF